MGFDSLALGGLVGKGWVGCATDWGYAADWELGMLPTWGYSGGCKYLFCQNKGKLGDKGKVIFAGTRLHERF